MAGHDNVFRGPQSVGQYFDPDCHLPLPLVEIPDRLNPYQKDKVRIYAKMMTCLPAQNVKSLPGKSFWKRFSKTSCESRMGIWTQQV